MERQRIHDLIEERFHGNEFTELIAEILRADNVRCEVSKPGADGGIDIQVLYRPYGLGPKIIVQVKSGRKRIGVEVVRQLQSTVAGDSGLLVCWGGLTKLARVELKPRTSRVAFWDADSVVDHFLIAWESLPEWVQDRLPHERNSGG
ncbi:restriction endonuclease [Leucobacter sp. Z1108]|uniref:restriction endonuclease n=1 Tax=Leucobacter sp. Z1108 TaxID=3439066 RepID=UPI003F30E672